MTDTVELTTDVTSFRVVAGQTRGSAQKRGEAWEALANHPIRNTTELRTFPTEADARRWLETVVPQLDRAKALHQLITELATEIADRALKDA